MPRRQPSAARAACAALASIVLVGTRAPSEAFGAEVDLVQWFADAAGPALQAAAPTNDPAVAGREGLNRGLSGAFSQLRRGGPTWLQGVELKISFDPTFRPSYAVSTTQPVLRSLDHNASIDLNGRVVHDTAGRTGGNLGLRYQGRIEGRKVIFGLEGAVENRWLEDAERYTIGAELHLSPLDVRFSLFDDVPQNLVRQIDDRRFDGYDLEINARILPGAWLKVRRFWQVEAAGAAEITRHRLSLRLAPLGPLEIDTGTESQANLRSWFAQLRWRIKLGG